MRLQATLAHVCSPRRAHISAPRIVPSELEVLSSRNGPTPMTSDSPSRPSTENSLTCLESGSGHGTSLLLQLALVHDDQLTCTLFLNPQRETRCALLTCERLFVTRSSNSLLSPARSRKPRVHLLSLFPAMERACDLSDLPRYTVKRCCTRCNADQRLLYPVMLALLGHFPDAGAGECGRSAQVTAQLHSARPPPDSSHFSHHAWGAFPTPCPRTCAARVKLLKLACHSRHCNRMFLWSSDTLAIHWHSVSSGNL